MYLPVPIQYPTTCNADCVKLHQTASIKLVANNLPEIKTERHNSSFVHIQGAIWGIFSNNSSPGNVLHHCYNVIS